MQAGNRPSQGLRTRQEPRRPFRCRASFSLAVLMYFLGLLVAFESQAQTTLYIVRHAEKAPASPGDEDPPLSTSGVARAQELAHLLRSVDLRAIYVTPYRRTRETAAPTAESKKLKPIEVEPEKLNAFADSLFTRQPARPCSSSGTATPPRPCCSSCARRRGRASATAITTISSS
jgi:hypothetical protein